MHATLNTIEGEGLNVSFRGFDGIPHVLTPAAAPPLAATIVLPDDDPPVSSTPPEPTPPAPSAGVIIVESDGTTVSTAAQPTDSYTVQLTVPSTETVYVTISAVFGGGSPYALISIDGGVTFADSAVLVFAPGEVGPYTVIVQLIPGTVPIPGEIVETISHTVQSADPAYNHAPVANVYVNLPPPKTAPPVPPTPPKPPVHPKHHGTSNGGTASSTQLAATGSDGLGGPAALLAALCMLLGALLLARRRRPDRVE